jgi:hypothetical protein
MANIPLQYPFPYKTINSTGFTSSVEFVNVTVLGDVTIDQNLTVSGNITTTDLTVGDDLTVGGQIDAQVLRAFGVWDTPIQTVNGAGAWIGFDGSGHTIFANRKSTAGQTNSFRWYAFDHTNAFQGELMRLSNAGNLFISGTRIEFPLIHLHQPPGTFPNYNFYLPSSMGSAGQVLTSAGSGLPTYWTTPSGGGGGGGTVTNVTGTSPVTVTSPSTTPNISLTTIPTTLGGTGLTTIGTNGQVLSSNGTNLQYVTLPTPVTSVSATSPLASSGGATPTISIASSTGTGAVVLQNDPLITTGLTIAGTTYSAGYIRSGTIGVMSGGNISDLYLTQVGLGGGYVNQYIRAAYDASFGYYISINPTNDFVLNGVRAIFNVSGNVGIGNLTPLYKLTVSGNDSLPADLTGAFSVQAASNDNQRLHMGYATVGDYGWIEAVNVGSNIQPLILQPRGSNVGIGTTTPLATLHTVGGDVLVEQNANFGNNIGVSIKRSGDPTTANNSEWYTYIPSGSSDLRFYSANLGANIVTIKTTGNVGIGTTTPGAKLAVNGTATLGYTEINQNSQTLAVKGTDHCYIRYNYGGVDKAYIGYGYANSTDLSVYNQINNGNVYVGSAGTGGRVYLENNTTITGTCRATNFTTNGSNTFTYEHGNFTPRLMAYRRPTGLAYELSGSLPGPCSITASYSVQTGRYVRVGQNLTINVEIRWTISTSGIGPDDYDIFVWIPDGFNPNAIAVAGPCLNFPNTIGGVSNPMGVLAQYPLFNAGGNVCAIFPTTTTGQIAYPIFAPGGTQILQFAMTYVIN